MQLQLRRKKLEDLVKTYLGQRIKIRSKGRTKFGRVESLILHKDKRGHVELSFEFDDERYPFADCKIIPEEGKDSEPNEQVQSSLYRLLTEKIRAGEAEFLVRKRSVSAWKVRPRGSASPITALFDETKQTVVSIR